MTKSSHNGNIDFGGPATYRIVVKGELEESWSDRLAGMAITMSHDDGIARTTLIGLIRDQAELSGVLDTLYGLHMTILIVEQVGDED